MVTRKGKRPERPKGKPLLEGQVSVRGLQVYSRMRGYKEVRRDVTGITVEAQPGALVSGSGSAGPGRRPGKH